MKDDLKRLGSFLFAYAKKATYAGAVAAIAIALPLMQDGVSKGDLAAAAGAFVAGFVGTFALKNKD